MAQRSEATARTTGDSQTTYWVVVVLGLVICIVIAALAVQSETPLKGLKLAMAGNAALVLIAGGSVAIERTLEAFWTIIDMLAGRSWPLGPQARRLNGLVAGMNTELSSALATLEADVQKYQATVPNVSERVNDVLGNVAAIRTNLKLAAVSVDNATISKAIGTINGSIAAIVAKYPVLTDKTAINDKLDESVTLAKSLQELLATFSSNPARRLLSIVAGAIIGLVVAFLLGLNVFTAIGSDGNATANVVVPSAPGIWVAITGLVMGLGSTPTHELIKAVQQQKQKQKKAS